MNYNYILDKLPFAEPFLFVDGLNNVDDNGVEGYFMFREEMSFYQGHFKDHPITPGVLLTECCAQIGLICLGIHLLIRSNTLSKELSINVALSSSEMEFLKPVYPNETVKVISSKVYFRFQKLKCNVKMYNQKGVLVCKGTLAGMLNRSLNEQ